MTLNLMPKSAQLDLLPWILGGVLVAAAVPAVMALTKGSTDEAPLVAVASGTANTVPPLAPRASSRPQSAATVPLAPSQSPKRIWQCVNNGQKTFSDSPCGPDASVRQLSEINRMDATPVSHATPQSSAYSAYPSQDYPPASPDQDAADAVIGSSTSQFIVIDERQRREHRHRMHEREHRIGLAHN
jgi:hypothetical protein